MLWASGSQGWTVPGMRRVRYYLTSYKLALPDITRVPPATNIALRRRLATEWKMCARDDSEAIQRRSHPPRWTVCSGTTCDCVCGPREAWTEPTIMPTVEWQGKTLILYPDPLRVPSKINKCLSRVTMSATAQTKGSHGYRACLWTRARLSITLIRKGVPISARHTRAK